MANTIMYVENHGYETKEALDSAYDAFHGNVTASRAALKRSEDGIKALNEQIHYTGQYLANKSVYAAYMKAKNKGRFRSELIAEQKRLRERYHSARNAEKELYTVKRNVDAILREPTLSNTRKQQRHTDQLE